MSTAHAKEGLEGTRRLIDELDDLMNQMLALPVDPAEETAGPASAGRDAMPTVAATLTLLPAALPQGTLAETPVEVDRTPALDATFTATEPENSKVSYATAENAAITMLQQVAAPNLAPLPRLPPLHFSAWKPNHLAYRLLTWVNERFDRATGRLGRTGAWLGSRTGKSILALCGIGLLLGGLAWLCADWMGWNW